MDFYRGGNAAHLDGRQRAAIDRLRKEFSTVKDIARRVSPLPRVIDVAAYLGWDADVPEGICLDPYTALRYHAIDLKRAGYRYNPNTAYDGEHDSGAIRIVNPSRFSGSAEGSQMLSCADQGE